MEDSLEIPLRHDRSPSALRIVGWLVGANIVVAMVSVVVIGGLTSTMGAQWLTDPVHAVGAMVGALLLIAVIFSVVYASVRHRNKVAAILRFGDEVALVDSDGALHASAPADALTWRAVQLYDSDGSETYPVGPAMELTFPQRKVVVAFRNSAVRWSRDVASVMKTDWVCDEPPFTSLLEVLEVEDELVPY